MVTDFSEGHQKDHMRTRRTNSSAGIFAEQLSGKMWSSLTPESLFKRLVSRRDSGWLDCAQFDKAGKSWSYVLLNPDQHLEVHPHKVLSRPNSYTKDSILRLTSHYLSRLFSSGQVADFRTPDAPPFSGGWVGYIGYDAFNAIDPVASDEDHFPIVALSLFTSVLAYSHEQKCWWAAATALSATTKHAQELECRKKIKLLLEQIAPITGNPESIHPVPRKQTCVSNCNRAAYENSVSRALQFIRDGDIYQINLAQRLQVPWELSPELLYLRLRESSPSRYGAFFGSGLVASGKSICSISPELFLRVEGRAVITRPIKGTRLRGNDAQEETRARNELSNSAKERAELNMIVDLERNDLGRVCEFGSVQVLSSGEIEALPTLLHRVATVVGKLKPGCSPLRLLRATFPGGSVTGAPKIRAMQIIQDLEPSPRGPYCGVIGWLGFNGDMELSIAIRTALYDASKRCAYYHAGSGIVADSVPALEYEETLHKAAAFFRATNSELHPDFRHK
jgi:anthranilate/para-aminobenzoate synthase component I